MKKQLLSMIALGVLGGLFMTGTSWSQNANNRTSKVTNQPDPNAAGKSDVKPMLFGGGGALGDGMRSGFMAPPRSEIEQLMTQLREADDDATKADLTKKLEAAVVTNFDEDMTSRETELTKLEERLTKLRAQLDRRRKAKSEIIQLQIKVMVNEADGLGFSGASGINAVPFDGASPFGRTGVSRLGGPTRGTTNGPTPAPTDDDFTPRKK